MNNSINGFLGEAEVKEITSLSRTTRWRMERAGTFPRRRQISENRIAWVRSEILEWIAAKADGTAEGVAA